MARGIDIARLIPASSVSGNSTGVVDVIDEDGNEIITEDGTVINPPEDFDWEDVYEGQAIEQEPTGKVILGILRPRRTFDPIEFVTPGISGFMSVMDVPVRVADFYPPVEDSSYIVGAIITHPSFGSGYSTYRFGGTDVGDPRWRVGTGESGLRQALIYDVESWPEYITNKVTPTMLENAFADFTATYEEAVRQPDQGSGFAFQDNWPDNYVLRFWRGRSGLGSPGGGIFHTYIYLAKKFRFPG